MNKFFQVLIFLLSLNSYTQVIYLHCGKVIDTESGKILKNKTIIVSDNKIAEIKNGYVYYDDSLRDFSIEFDSILNAFDSELSLYIDSSDISKFNNGSAHFYLENNL